MPRVKALGLTVAVALAVTGCGPMFEFNLFAGIDNPPARTAADYTGAEGLDQLDQDLDSPAMVDALAADPGLVQEILDNLENDYLADGVSGDEDGQAAILYADLALKTTEGENLVNNVVGALLDGSLATSTNIGDLLAAIMPPEALASEDTFTAMIAALLAANDDAYEPLGTYVDGNDDGSPTNPLPPGSAPGDIVQKSVVAYTMRFLVDTVVSDLPAADDAAAAVQLYLVATDNTTDPRYDGPGWAAMPPVDPMASPPNWLQALMGLAPLP